MDYKFKTNPFEWLLLINEAQRFKPTTIFTLHLFHSSNSRRWRDIIIYTYYIRWIQISGSVVISTIAIFHDIILNRRSIIESFREGSVWFINKNYNSRATCYYSYYPSIMFILGNLRWEKRTILFDILKHKRE